jgi:large subunit ribosomal protein L32
VSAPILLVGGLLLFTGRRPFHPVVFKDASTGTALLTRSTATSDRTIEWTDANTRHRRSQWKATAPDLVPITVNGRRILVPRNLIPAYQRGLLG